MTAKRSPLRRLQFSLLLATVVVLSDGCTSASKGSAVSVDWDVTEVSSDGRTIHLDYEVNKGCWDGAPKVSVEETPLQVTIIVRVGGEGDRDASCDTAYATRRLIVELRTPLNGRMLLGCRLPDSGVLAPTAGHDGLARDPLSPCPAP